MKATYILSLLLASLLVSVGCRKGADYRTVLYFTGTEEFTEKTLTIERDTSIGVSITSSVKVEKDVTVKASIKPEMVAQYNSANGTNYKFLPADSYTWQVPPGDFFISNGSNRSAAANFTITTLANFEQGVTYCVPISITDVEGGIDVLESARTMYIIVKRTIITQAASLVSNRYFKVPSFATSTSLNSIPKFTMECRVFMNGFQTANPFISSIMGIEENFLLRFGDVSIPNNQLQLAGGLLNGNKYPVSSKSSFATGKWYHVAVVYNGATIALYINGVMDNYTDAANGGINLTDNSTTGFYIGYSAGGRYLNGSISEARVWTKALTAKELQNNLCYVPPTSEGLLAYWRFDGNITGNTVPDITGHGHDAVGNNTITWVPGVRCP